MAETKYFSHELQLSKHSNPASSTFPARIAYRTYGVPSNPAVLLPTCYGGKLDTTLPFLYTADDNGTKPVLSGEKYFVIVCALMGGGESSSPSNTPAPFNGPNFPNVTYEDNITLQRELCRHLGVQSLYAYIGFSMGGQQAYHMAALHPDFVQRIVCIAGSARTSWHNWSFIEGPKAALVNSVDFHDGHYSEPARKGTGAFGRVYSTWALSQEWYRQRCWEKRGYATLEEFLTAEWQNNGLGAWDANDLLCLAWTWQKGDITLYYPDDKGDLTKTLARIKAKCLLMPSRTDMYFPPEDNVEEQKHLKTGKLAVIESIWGHLGGGGMGTESDNEFIKDQVAAFLEETV